MEGFIIEVNSSEGLNVVSCSVSFVLTLTWCVNKLFEKLAPEIGWVLNLKNNLCTLCLYIAHYLLEYAILEYTAPSKKNRKTHKHSLKYKIPEKELIVTPCKVTKALSKLAIMMLYFACQKTLFSCSLSIS